MSSQPAEYLQSNSRTQVAEALNKVLANSYVLYFKTHSYHWNVEGPLFKALHDLFELQYTELWQALDVLAERLRALDVYAPINSADMVKNSTLKSSIKIPDGKTMASELAKDNTELAKILMESISIAQDAGDEVTTDMLIGRANIHEKNAWMLRSMITD